MHVLRNSLVPVVTLVGLSFPQIIGGALVVESLFNIQGMGWQIWQAAQNHDFPVTLGLHAGDRQWPRRSGRCWPTSATRCSTRESGTGGHDRESGGARSGGGRARRRQRVRWRPVAQRRRSGLAAGPDGRPESRAPGGSAAAMPARRPRGRPAAWRPAPAGRRRAAAWRHAGPTRWQRRRGLIIVAVVAFCFLGPLFYHTDLTHVFLSQANLSPGAGHPLGHRRATALTSSAR